MKILHIINNLGSGGAEKLIEQILPKINEFEDIEVQLLLLTDEKNVFEKSMKKSEILITTIPLKNPRNPLNILYIRKFIIKNKFDIIHVHLFPSSYWTSIASKLIFKNKPKLIFTEHNTYNRRRNKPYLRMLEKFIYSSFNTIISISKKTQDNLIEWLQVNEKNKSKYKIIENGIDVNFFEAAEPYKKNQLISIKETSSLVCMVGSFSEQKDQATLIKAITRLENNVNLLLIGEGLLKERNEKLAKEMGVSHRVHFMGFRNDVGRILKTIDIVVLSSKWEGFGLAVVEGMAAGKPVIASDVPGLREVVEGYGELFDVGNDKLLANKITELLKDRKRYNIQVNKSTKHARSYDISVMVNDLLNVYK